MRHEGCRSWQFCPNTHAVLLMFAACVASFAGGAAAGDLRPRWSNFDCINTTPRLFIPTSITIYLRLHLYLKLQPRDRSFLIIRRSKSGSLPVKRPRCYPPASKTTAHAHTSSLSTTMLRTAKLTHYSFEYNAHVIRTFVLFLRGSHATTFL